MILIIRSKPLRTILLVWAKHITIVEITQKPLRFMKGFFEVMNVVFKNECPPPYHDFDSGDCYLLLAQAYLAIGESDKAMDSVESSIMYYINLLKKETDDENYYPIIVCSPIVKKRELKQRIPKDIIKRRLQIKLSNKCIEELNQNTRFVDLLDMVNSI